MVKKIIEDFLDNELGELINNGYIYNEFSLQHELGIYLRNVLPNYRVLFEQNISSIPNNVVVGFEKKEMDIYIENMNNQNERYAIELKYPKNGQYPAEMYQFVRDICFMEQVKNAGAKTYVLTLVDNHLFYKFTEKEPDDGIYDYFRKGALINGKIEKPTSCEGSPFVTIAGECTIKWKDVLCNGIRVVKKIKNKEEKYKYYFHEIK